MKREFRALLGGAAVAPSILAARGARAASPFGWRAQRTIRKPGNAHQHSACAARAWSDRRTEVMP